MPEDCIKKVVELDIINALMNIGDAIISEFTNGLDQESKKTNVFLVGKTGAGKSTLTNYLTDVKLKAVGKRGKFTINLEEEKHGRPKIAKSALSQTTFPNKVEYSNTTYWDCPGFDDNKGPLQDIANAYYIKRLFDNLKNVKVVVVIDVADMETKARGLIEVFNQLSELFEGHIEKLFTAVTLIVTKTTWNSIDCQECLMEDIIPVAADMKFKPDAIRLLKYIVNNNKVVAFNSPTKEGNVLNKNYDEIMTAINAAEIIKGSVNVQVSIDSDSKLYAKDLFKSFEYNIGIAMSHFVTSITNDLTKIKGDNIQKVIQFCNWFKDEAVLIKDYPKLIEELSNRLTELKVNLEVMNGVKKVFEGIKFFQKILP